MLWKYSLWGKSRRRDIPSEMVYEESWNWVLNDEQCNQKKANGETGCYCTRQISPSKGREVIKHCRVCRELKAFRSGWTTNPKVREGWTNAGEKGEGQLMNSPPSTPCQEIRSSFCEALEGGRWSKQGNDRVNFTFLGERVGWQWEWWISEGPD